MDERRPAARHLSILNKELANARTAERIVPNQRVREVRNQHSRGGGPRKHERFDPLAGLDPTVSGGAIAIDNPNVGWTDPLALRVQDVLDTQVNPGVAAHGGYIDLLEVRDGTAYISMGGGCVGCAQVDVTLRQGVEVAIRRSVPEIGAIVDTTDHASGTNPYYQSAKK